MTDMNVNGSVPIAVSTLENGDKNAKQVPTLESDKEREERFCSLRIIYFTMFLISLGFSIVLTGIWPYLDKVCVTFTSTFTNIKLFLFSSSTLSPVKSSWDSLLPPTL